MNRTTVAAIAGLSAGMVQAAASRVEVHEGSRLYGVLSLSPAGDRLMLAHQGREAPLGECADEEQGNTGSQRGILASVVERNCGATVDFATRIELRSGDRRMAIAVFGGRVSVSLKWTAEGLAVTHAPVGPDRVYRRAETAFGTQVIYTSSGAPAPATEYSDFSNFNYGATGRASGVPAELLLRVAGWSQQASGLYRPEWGTWNGAPPYGDDPAGSTKIREGIAYYEQNYKSNQQ
jgi:hypothetical protein